MWLNQNFLLQEDIAVEGQSLNVNFLSLRGSGPLVIKMEQVGQASLLSEFVQIEICLDAYYVYFCENNSPFVTIFEERWRCSV